jgi:hypothetical protein
MQKNNTFFTFDFELFLGSDSGSIEDCLVPQTIRILNLFENYKAVGLFFIDSSYLLKLTERAFLEGYKAALLKQHQDTVWSSLSSEYREFFK